MRRLLSFCVLAFGGLGAISQAALAQDRSNALLEGINIAVVMPADLTANPGRGECGITESAVSGSVIEPVQQAGLRTQLLATAQRFTTTTAGVYLIPVIATLKTGPSCVSWVGLKAQAAYQLVLPGSTAPKNQQVLYWDRGMLVDTAVGNHPNGL